MLILSFMKKTLLLLLAAFVVSCNGHKKEAAGRETGTVGMATPPSGAGYSLTWIDQFREFRNAVYARDKAKVKQFFNFPVMNENNEIWYLANDGRPGNDLSPDTIKPFTGRDFDRYFYDLFSKKFIAALLKIKSDELYKKDHTETPEFRENDHSTYRIIADYDTKERTLTLNLFTNAELTDEKGEALDGGESSIIYYFAVSADNHLTFKKIRIAG